MSDVEASSRRDLIRAVLVDQFIHAAVVDEVADAVEAALAKRDEGAVEAADIVAALAAAEKRFNESEQDVDDIVQWQTTVECLGVRAVSWQAEHGTEERT